MAIGLYVVLIITCMNIDAIILEGEFVRLEPLRMDHIPAFCEVGLDPSLWEWMANIVSNKLDIEKYVTSAIEDHARGIAADRHKYGSKIINAYACAFEVWECIRVEFKTDPKNEKSLTIYLLNCEIKEVKTGEIVC